LEFDLPRSTISLASLKQRGEPLCPSKALTLDEGREHGAGFSENGTE